MMAVFLKRFWPLLVFIILAIFLAIGLTKNPRLVPSPFIGKAAPNFTLPLLNSSETINQDIFISDEKGIKLLNVWASWCPECWGEHAFLMELADSGVEIIGLNYKNEAEGATDMITRVGNPFTHIAFDYDGKVGIDYGVYGAPETFIINNHGVILYKHIGELNAAIWQERFMPVIQGYINAAG